MKKENIFLFRGVVAFVFVAILCLACSKSGVGKFDDDEDVNNDNECIVPVFYKGWGTCSFDKPEGTALQLPAGVTFVAAQQPITFDEKDSCGFKFEGDPRSWDVGGHVVLCVSFRNSTSKPLKLTLPPGLIFVSRDPFGQNGILAIRVSMLIPANTTLYNQLNMHCINGSKKTSGNVDLPYDLGPITNVKPAQELIAFLEGKDIMKASNQIRSGVSIAFSDIDGKGKIRESTWEILNKLPNK